MPHKLHRQCGRRVSRRVDGKCHRKHTARFDSPQGDSPRARVKRWGKSPPRRRRRRRHEKPHPVQGKIGGWVARPSATGMPHPPSLAQASFGGQVFREAGVREMTTEAPPGVEQNPAYRPQNQALPAGPTAPGDKPGEPSARIFHSEETSGQRKTRPPSPDQSGRVGRSDSVAASPDFVGPTGRRFHTSRCEIFGWGGSAPNSDLRQ